jgi:hypothetical protein
MVDIFTDAPSFQASSPIRLEALPHAEFARRLRLRNAPEHTAEQVVRSVERPIYWNHHILYPQNGKKIGSEKWKI